MWWRQDNNQVAYECVMFRCYVVFVKDALLYFTNCSHERRRREIVIMSAKHEAERNAISEA